MIIFLLSAFILTIESTTAAPPIIFGEDDRLDTYEVSSPLLLELARSTAAQIPNERIKSSDSGIELIGQSLTNYMDVCSDEKFASQPSIANCSGFLVAPDIIATAGHCYEREGMCENYSWVFDFKKSEADQTIYRVGDDDVYRCQEVLEYGFDFFTIDYALIRLDRPVKGREVLKLQAEPKKGDPLVIIGHPSGLPQKTAGGAKVMSISETEFTGNVDAFAVNSGSAIFNEKTGEVIGILAKGYADYVSDKSKSCLRANRVLDDHPGNIMSKNSQFADLLKRYTLRDTPSEN